MARINIFLLIVFGCHSPFVGPVFLLSSIYLLGAESAGLIKMMWSHFDREAPQDFMSGGFKTLLASRTREHGAAFSMRGCQRSHPLLAWFSWAQHSIDARNPRPDELTHEVEVIGLFEREAQTPDGTMGFEVMSETISAIIALEQIGVVEDFVHHLYLPSPHF